jgi:hypothetical protein
MPAGLGGGNYLFIALETTMGSYLDPTTVGGVFVPYLTESLAYQEDKYYSAQIRQSTVVSEVEQSYYSVSGDITMEVDCQFLPYFMHCSRHAIAKTGAGPYTYTYTPSSAGSASTAASGNVPRTASITVVRNGVGFGYAGCVMGGYEFTIEDGVLRVTFNVLGLSENDAGGLGTPTWTDARIHGAAAHSIYVAASGTAPTFGAADLTFNGYTFTANFNAAAQNRIRADRSASYISYGESEITYSTELDFLNKTEYNNFKNASTRAIRLESNEDNASYATATRALRIDINRSAYDTYDLGSPAIGDLVMAGVTGRVIGIAGGNPYSIAVKSAANIA